MLFSYLTVEMFKVRMKNFLTRVMGVYLDQDKYNEFNIEKISEQVAQDFMPEAIFQESLVESLRKIEEKLEKVKEIEEGRSWISPYLHEYKEEVTRIFDKHAVDEGLIEGNAAKSILVAMLQLFRVSIGEKDMFLFERMVENRFKSQSKPVKYLKLSYSKFAGLIEEWALKESISHLSFASNLEATISHYKDLSNNCEFPKLSRPLKDLVKQLQSIQSGFNSKVTHSTDTLVENRLKALKEIFKFYAKQLKMLGNAPTFEEITDHQSMLNISKFTKFCNDFDITNKNNKDHLSVQQVTQAFLNGNNCSRTMDYSQFILALDSLSQMYFGEQYDSRNHTCCTSLKIEEKRNLFYELLRLDNRNEYMQKAKGFGLPFSNEKAGYRIPDYDLSKKYKFKDTSHIKEKVSEWKKGKEEKPSSLRSISIPNPARLAAVKNSLLQRKDRITWDILKNSQQSALISKEELNCLFTDSDIKEIIASSKNIYK